MTYDERFPVILPNKSKLCENFVKLVHKVLIHGGTKLMMTTIRSQFYVPRLKRTVKKHVNNCLICVRHKQKVKSQLMAALPLECSITLNGDIAIYIYGCRLCRPFPGEIRKFQKSRFQKAYVCIFVWFSTKAIHIESCFGLTSATS